MSDLWVTIPVTDVRVVQPLSIEDRNVKLMFRDVETIDSVIAQLESIKEMIDGSVPHFA